MEVYVCDRFHVIVFFKGEKGSFLKHQEYEKKSSFTSKMSVSI